jgi:hypothetical protein
MYSHPNISEFFTFAFNDIILLFIIIHNSNDINNI